MRNNQRKEAGNNVNGTRRRYHRESEGMVNISGSFHTQVCFRSNHRIRDEKSEDSTFDITEISYTPFFQALRQKKKMRTPPEFLFAASFFLSFSLSLSIPKEILAILAFSSERLVQILLPLFPPLHIHEIL